METKNADSKRLTDEILDAFNLLQENAGLIRHGASEVAGGIGLAELHCVDWMGRLPQANVTRVAARMGLTRGAVCKIAKRLLAKGLVTNYCLPDNRKEVYYRLTAAGRRVFAEHARCHAAARSARSGLLAAYDADERKTILRFLTDINRLFAERQQEKF